ncbi:MAG: fatty acid--CoA ligase family protein [Campylobacterota bacterium]|nr:fatty acid--CoA ligase family protein [Campylobacterota bacterium]
MNWFIESFKKFDDKIAIVFKNKNYSYNDLYNKIKKIEDELLLKIEKGEVVSILSDYSFESIALLIALYKNKNIIVPITTNIKSEINERVEESYTDKIIKIVNENYILEENISKEKHQMIKSLQDNYNSGLVLFSSGSTGKPKAMIHNFDNLVEHYNNKKEKSLNMILFLMFDHIGGLNTLLNILSMGATMIIPENRNADDICKLLQDFKIRVLPSSPTFLNLILMSKSHEKYDLKSLRMITYGTEAMPDSLLTRLKESFPKTKFLQTFGTSETGIANTSSKSSNSTFMKIDDPELEYKIVDNELWLKSKTQVMGYLNSSMDSFTEDGWFKTGDLVETTDDGYLKIIGRNKEVINVGGEKVLPNEVESIILSVPQIEDAMVYGEQNIITGQTVICDVVLKESLESKEIKKIVRKYCKDKLDSYKIPTKINIVEKTNFGDRFKKIRRK